MKYEIDMTLPLEDITVLDLSRVGPGSFCTGLLGDLGANVIKVEAPYDPESPPIGSGVSPHPKSKGAERAAAYHPTNRNKISIALNLRLAPALEIFYKLAETADVVLEGFRPGVVKRLGIDYPAIRKINPRVIYCSLSGYGQDGPYQLMPGHDINYISVAGALGIIGQRGGPPVIPSNFIADYAGGSLYAVIGILAALRARDKTDKGQHIDIALTDGVISLLGIKAAEYFCNGVIPHCGEDWLGGREPSYNVYRTREGKYISIGCLEPYFWERLCQALGREDLIPHQNTEGELREKIFSDFKAIFLTKTGEEWLDLLQQKDIPATKVYELDEVFSDPQVLHRGMVTEVPHATLGKIKQVGIAIKLSETPGKVRHIAPLLGQHTSEILHNLGYTNEQIKELKEAGAVL